MYYNLYQEDMLTSHYRIIDYNIILERQLSKSGFKSLVSTYSTTPTCLIAICYDFEHRRCFASKFIAYCENLFMWPNSQKF